MALVQTQLITPEIVVNQRPPGQGLEISTSAIRATVNKRFQRSELIGISSINIPSGYYVAVVGLKTTAASSSDYYNTGWMTETTNPFTLPDEVWQYFAINFRRADNGNITATDLTTLNAGTAVMISSAPMSKELLSRRASLMSRKGEELILVLDTTITNEVIQPISFDSTTGYFEVDSFPSNFNVALNTNTNVRIHILNTSVSPTLLPCKYNDSNIVIQKVDNTHFTIASNSVSSSGNYDVTAFCLEYNPPELVRLCGTDMMYDNLFKIEVTGVLECINKYKTVGLHGISNYPSYAATLIASSIGYIYGRRLCDMTLYVRLGSDNSFYGYLKRETGFSQGDRTWSLSRFTYKNLELTLDSGFGWGGRTGLYFRNIFLNGSNVKCYKVVE